ncbi:MAG: lactate racemase domain-containing protein, partial [Spirochaetaceae bacterium]|nr:lactate racemase domain-containing protein [Spirochaetaceae bacterium]
MIPKVTGPERPPYLSEGELGKRVDEALSRIVRSGEKVLCVVPDQTRTFPLPFFFRRIFAALAGRVASLDFMIALGTHPSLGRDAIDRLFGLAPGELESAFKGTRILNHAWKDESALASVGTISAAEIEALSGGLLSLDLDVKINARALEYDRLLVCGPVFPHEVAGFSGGNKYFFPGISGPDVIDATHWLGALVTSRETIGVKDTAVRRAIDLAASRLPTPRSALCAVVDHHGVFGLFSGSCEGAWSEAVALAARTHIAYLDEPVRRVVSILPEMYDELWVGAKGMYKLEPVVADGGEIVV